MVRLAEEVFAARTDPDQLDVNEQVIQHLLQIHQATVSEYSVADGPVAWVLLIPTTSGLMNRFLDMEISEKQLYDLTPGGCTYDAIYLCSALILEEYRRQGIAGRLVLDAIYKIQNDHPIKALFAWVFSPEGGLVADSIARKTGLPLFKRLK